ncbi:MAG TPA: hypothetical protein DCM62_10525 [Bacteroidales bacterium]|nr:hypothetical protein [Bacteroidales bacterium]
MKKPFKNDNGAFEYNKKPEEKLGNDFRRREILGLNDFADLNAFKEWYHNQEKVCYFCGLKEEDCQEIVITGVLKSRRFPQDGKSTRGRSRGVWLEIDRLDPTKKYSPENCKLCCYFCNNDKSDVFHGEDYKAFIKDRVKFLREKLTQK